MRIMTVRQPWAWAIIHATKDVENRSTNIAGAYRGPVAIHAGLAVDLDALATVNIVGSVFAARMRHGAGDRRTFKESPRGAIIGVVDLVDVHNDCTRTKFTPPDYIEPETCSPWGDPDVWHLVLANPRPLSEPIPYRGALGLREVPADLLARIEATL